MEYFYRIHFNDGTTKDFTGQEVVGKKLTAYDKFSMTDKFQEYIKEGCRQAGKSITDIKSVKIAHVKKRGDLIEFNLLDKNPYFSDIYKYTKEANVIEYNYTTQREVISTESEDYKEMRDYVLEQLKTNSKVFLNDVYRYPNKFKAILQKYADSYSSEVLEEEEYHHIYELEKSIRHHLTIYKTYRGMAVQRYKYETYNKYYNLNNNTKNTDNKLVNNIELHNKVLEEHYHKLDNVTHRTREYNEKYEEFIEPDEYGQMNGYTGEKVL